VKSEKFAKLIVVKAWLCRSQW